MPKHDSILIAFGQSVRKHRDTKGFSQEVLAEKAGLDRTYISDIERGIRNPSILSIVRIAKALGIPVSQLTNGLRG